MPDDPTIEMSATAGQSKLIRPQRASIHHVAARAGVSPMTVSNVIRNRTDQMGEETRRRVLEAIKDLDYVPVRTTMQNRHVETRVIGVVFNHDLKGFVGHFTFDGMTDRAKEIDYDLLMFLRPIPEWIRPGTANQFLDRRCDGFIFVGSPAAGLTESLIKHGIPVVECFNYTDVPGSAYVVPDNASAMAMAVHYLYSKGHRRIAHLGGPVESTEANVRCESFLRTVSELGIPECRDCCIQAGDWFVDNYTEESFAGPKAVCDQILDWKPTAVVCANDFLALGLWSAAEKRGMRVPKDLSITGMDNTNNSVARGLTTIKIAFEVIGRTAMDAIAGILRGESPSEVTRQIPVEIVERSTVADAPKRCSP